MIGRSDKLEEIKVTGKIEQDIVVVKLLSIKVNSLGSYLLEGYDKWTDSTETFVMDCDEEDKKMLIDKLGDYLLMWVPDSGDEHRRVMYFEPASDKMKYYAKCEHLKL